MTAEPQLARVPGVLQFLQVLRNVELFYDMKKQWMYTAY